MQTFCNCDGRLFKLGCAQNYPLSKRIWLSVLIAITLSVSSIMSLASANISLLPSESPIFVSGFELDDRTRVGLHEPSYIFKFIAYKVCNHKYGQCFDIWGQGNYNDKFKEVTAYGYYLKYIQTPTNELEMSRWLAVDFLNASDTHVIFKAEPTVKGPGGAGFIVIEVFNGETSETGRICVYGNLFDKQKASGEADADCTGSAYVKIEPAP